MTGGDGDRLGRVAFGYCADMTVMAQDPADADPDELIAVPVLLTVVDGEVVFRSDSLS